MADANSAVCVDNAWKFYGKKEILRGLNMRVPKGAIYGFLGPSGCGKTTLLGCIVNSKLLDSGDIWVMGGIPGSPESGIPGSRVGYMPQEISLVGEFTIEDSFYYFGRIVEMDDMDIEERLHKLSILLDLPDKKKYIKNCSGGQQRRVSFAVSLIHMPELLILDEPTVGVDPILRDRIWNYLVELTQTKEMTIIITTHYIEETRQANMVGLMREGILLMEESPANLLSMFNSDSLERVFYLLSKNQDENSIDNQISNKHTKVFMNDSSTNISISSYNSVVSSKEALSVKKKIKKLPTTKIFEFNLKRVKALMDKNLKQFFRNTTGLIFILIFPLLKIFAFLSAVGDDVKNIPIGIVNHETFETTCTGFKNNGTLHLKNFTCEMEELSCRFLNMIEDPMISKVRFRDLDEALKAVHWGETTGVIFIAANFSKSLQERIHDTRIDDGAVVNFSQIPVWLDMSNRQIGESLKYKLHDFFKDFGKSVMDDCKFNSGVYDFYDLTTLYGEKDEIMTIFMVPGIVQTIILFTAIIMTSQLIISDRFEGVWERSSIAGVSSFEITATHFLLQASVVGVHVIMVFIVTFGIYKIENSGSIWVLALITYFEGIVGMCIGFLISIISGNHSMANICTAGLFYLMVFIAGIFWPIEAMPIGLRYISCSLPITLNIGSFRNVMKKGWSITDLEVFSGMLIVIFWSFGLALLSIYLIKKKR